MKIKTILKNAKNLQKSIVFPEAAFSDRTVEAVKILNKKKIVKPILIGDESALILRDKKLSEFEIINPQNFQHRDKLKKVFLEKRKDKGLTEEEAENLLNDPYYFSTLLVESGFADGMLGGAETSTANMIKPALQIIKTKRKGGTISAAALMIGKNKFLKGKALLIADTAVLPNPDSEQLCQIALDSEKTFLSLGFLEPRIAFLSYSTKGSAKGELVTKVKEAYEAFIKKSNAICDGEVQFDAAMKKQVADLKCPNSKLKGDANILIFPELNTGNICYKAIEYIGGLMAVGQILQGLRKPVNDLSRGCTVDEIVVMAAITALQTEEK